MQVLHQGQQLTSSVACASFQALVPQVVYWDFKGSPTSTAVVVGNSSTREQHGSRRHFAWLLQLPAGINKGELN